MDIEVNVNKYLPYDANLHELQSFFSKQVSHSKTSKMKIIFFW
jgi:hypothetical protein